LVAALVDELLALPDEDLRPLAHRLVGFLATAERDADFLSVAQAAERLEVHPNTVYRMIVRGHLRATKAGRLWWIPAEELGRIESTPTTASAPSRRRAPRPVRRRFGRLVRELS